MAKRTISDKSLKNRAYEIARNDKYDGYQRALASMVYKFWVTRSECKWTTGWRTMAIKKFKIRKAYARFKDNIWSVYLAKMGSLPSNNKNVKYL